MKTIITTLLLIISLSSFSQKGWYELKPDNPKTDTVKGYIEYYRTYIEQGRRVVTKNETLNLEWFSDTSAIKVIEPAIAIYDVTTGQVPCPDKNYYSCFVIHYGDVKTLNKILVNGKDFNLKKRYTFIPLDDIVE
jgi:hypothetical protein